MTELTDKLIFNSLKFSEVFLKKIEGIKRMIMEMNSSPLFICKELNHYPLSF